MPWLAHGIALLLQTHSISTCIQYISYDKGKTNSCKTVLHVVEVAYSFVQNYVKKIIKNEPEKKGQPLQA